MDPTQALQEILELLADADGGPAPTEATDLLRALTEWLDKGGFAPDVQRAIDAAGFDLNT